MLRWVFDINYDTRKSIIYIISNQTTLQILAQKAVFRFFKHIQEHPRFVTTFIQKVRTGIDPDLLGVSTITWWDQLTLSQGKLENTKPFYNRFRQCINRDLSQSTRLEATGLEKLLADVASYCFAGEPCLPPPKARTILAELVQPDHALVNIMHRGKVRTLLHHWPSWLNRGYFQHLKILKDIFYPVDAPAKQNLVCKLCQTNVNVSSWRHIFYDCTELHKVHDSV